MRGPKKAPQRVALISQLRAMVRRVGGATSMTIALITQRKRPVNPVRPVRKLERRMMTNETEGLIESWDGRSPYG